MLSIMESANYMWATHMGFIKCTFDCMHHVQLQGKEMEEIEVTVSRLGHSSQGFCYVFFPHLSFLVYMSPSHQLHLYQSVSSLLQCQIVPSRMVTLHSWSKENSNLSRTIWPHRPSGDPLLSKSHGGTT